MSLNDLFINRVESGHFLQMLRGVRKAVFFNISVRIVLDIRLSAPLPGMLRLLDQQTAKFRREQAKRINLLRHFGKDFFSPATREGRVQESLTVVVQASMLRRISQGVHR